MGGNPRSSGFSPSGTELQTEDGTYPGSQTRAPERCRYKRAWDAPSESLGDPLGLLPAVGAEIGQSLMSLAWCCSHWFGNS